MPDDDLITRAKAGDPDAWTDLYGLHASRLLALLRVLPDPDAAISHDDLAAHAWLTAADKIGGFSGTADAFGGWLYVVARNQGSRAATRASHAATPVPAGMPTDLDSTAIFEAADVAALRLEGIRDLLAHLPPGQRSVIACLDVAGMDIATTARALGMSQTAVRVARHRGLARLKRAVTQP